MDTVEQGLDKGERCAVVDGSRLTIPSTEPGWIDAQSTLWHKCENDRCCNTTVYCYCSECRASGIIGSRSRKLRKSRPTSGHGRW